MGGKHFGVETELRPIGSGFCQKDRSVSPASSVCLCSRVQSIAHSTANLFSPRIMNWRKPRACLI